jgi:glycosyltransferase involved in cell wall biosynthesis
MAAPLRVAIAVRVDPGLSGGVAPAVGSLIHALGRLTDGPEQYTLVVTTDQQEAWLRPLVGPNQQIKRKPQSRKDVLLRHVRPAIRAVQKMFTLPRYWPETPISDGFYERLGCDLIHFPTQSFTLCGMRTVYNPIDLQHLHYPEFFEAWMIAWRETVYRTGCSFSQALIVNSQWIKDDVVRQYRVDPDKIRVVAEAPPTFNSKGLSDAELASLTSRYQLEPQFILYPSVTWPHKNHIRLFEALAHLRDTRGLRLQLICTGSRYDEFWPSIQNAIRDLSLESQVKFLGHVPHDDLRGLYRLATAMALPSLFEANSLPVFEAWFEGTPVACSNTTGLPEQVGDAGVLFDPMNSLSIADALGAIATNPSLRATLRTRGRQRSAEFSWDATARAYREIYRQVAGRATNVEEPRALHGANVTPLEWAMEARAR